MIFIRQIEETAYPTNMGSERTVEIREFKEVIDVWEHSRVLSFGGYMTPVDKGGYEESCKYIKWLLDSRQPFVLAVGLMDHETEDITGDIEEGEHGVTVITFQAIEDYEWESYLVEPPDQERDPAIEGVGNPYDYNEEELPDDPFMG